MRNDSRHGHLKEHERIYLTLFMEIIGRYVDINNFLQGLKKKWVTLIYTFIIKVTDFIVQLHEKYIYKQWFRLTTYEISQEINYKCTLEMCFIQEIWDNSREKTLIKMESFTDILFLCKLSKVIKLRKCYLEKLLLGK